MEAGGIAREGALGASSGGAGPAAARLGFDCRLEQSGAQQSDASGPMAVELAMGKQMIASQPAPSLSPPAEPNPPAVDERRIARELSPSLAVPTLLLAVFLPSAFVSVIVLGSLRAWPFWACTPLLSILAYAHYTLVHEAIHHNIVPGHRKLQGLEVLIGWVGSLALGTSWPALQRTHVLHHTHTNSDKDPDIWVKGSGLALLRKWGVNVLLSPIPAYAFKYIAPEEYRKAREVLTTSEILQTSAVTAASTAMLLVCLLIGRPLDWVFLWFVPTQVGALLLHVLFQWMPHYPFDRTERYYNTRLSFWPGGGVFTLQQNLHLMHHLWPSVPFYNYARMYREFSPMLAAKGCRVEGLRVGSTVAKGAMARRTEGSHAS